MSKQPARRKQRNEEKPPHVNPDNENSFQVPAIKDISLNKIRTIIVNSRYMQILILLTAIGAFLRFYHLDYNSLWLDEAVTLRFARHSLIEIWGFTAGGEFNPPLFYWIEHFILLLGDSEFILRFIPALLGTLSIPLMYILGREFGNENTGIIAASLIAVSPPGVFYSQDARAYAVMVFFILITLIIYLMMIRSNDARLWILFGIFSAISFWVHFYVILGIGALLLHAFILGIKKAREDMSVIKNLAFSIIVLCLLTLPLLSVIVPLFATRTSSAPTFGYQGAIVIFQTFTQLSGYNQLIMMLFLFLLLIGLISLYLRDRNKMVLIVLYLCLPLLLSILISYKMPFMPRHLLFLLPIFLVGVASSHLISPSGPRGKTVMYLLIIFFVSINIPYFMNYYSTFQKEDWRGVSEKLQGMTESGDFIVLVPGYMNDPLDYYYSNASDRTFEFGAHNRTTLEEISYYRGNATIFYIVTWDIAAMNPEGDALAWLQEHSTVKEAYSGIYLLVSN